MRFGEVRLDGQEIINNFNITSFPSVLLFDDANKHHLYKGKVAHKDLFEYLSKPLNQIKSLYDIHDKILE